MVQEMWSGRPAYMGMPGAQMLHQVISGARPQLPPDASPGLRALADCCLAADHAQRPTSQQVLRELQALLNEELVLRAVDELLPGTPSFNDDDGAANGARQSSNG